MTPEQWTLAERLYHEAAAIAVADRDSWLARACGGDEIVRQEVESLLAQDASRAGALDGHALDLVTPEIAGESLVGRQLGGYAFCSLIDEGGMGQVYRARDLALPRDVAIKVVSPEFTHDAVRRQRFRKEAAILAGFAHPHIAHIYAFVEAEGRFLLAMEFVPGETLAERIARGPLRVGEALDIARQVADALDAAHQQGVIHRDLKPANIRITPDGVVKVLDFGLATSGRLARPADRTTLAQTAPGTLLGTVAYMSPEQARGESVDKRTDIWAFGCVLFEMLTGRRLFDSTSAADTLALVMTREVDWNLLPTPLPMAVRALLRRCLERDPRKRLGDVAAIRFALEDVAGTVAVGSAEAPPASFAPRRKERTAWMVAGVAMLVAVVLTPALYVVARPRGAQPLRLSMTLPEGWNLALSSSLGEPTSLVVSPNGRRVAIVARREDGPTTILMRELDSPSARPLSGTEGATSVFWSPDNRFIGFFADGKIKKVDLSGGAPIVLCEATAPFGGGTWGSEGTIVFSMREKGNYRLWKVADSGGQPTDALPDAPTSEATKGAELRPWFLPDGRTLLYALYIGRKATVYAGRVDSPDRVKVVETESSNAQYANGYLLFLRGATLMAEPFDEKRLAVTGSPVPVVDHVQRQGSIPPYRLFSASQNGVLAYQAGTDAATLAWVDRRGQTLGTIGEPANYQAIALSHDETRVVAVIGESPDLFIINLSNGVRTQLTFDHTGGFPVWSHDDRFIDFNATPPNGLLSGFRKPSNGAGASERVLPDEKGPHLIFDRGWDDSLLVMIPHNLPSTDLTVLSGSGDRTPFRLASTPQDKRIGKFSPDGRWVAYVSNVYVFSNESGSGQNVWVVPVVRRTGAGDVKYLISTGADGGTLPQWSADGRELFYVSSSEMLTAVPVNGDGQAFRLLAPPKALFPIRVSQSEGGYTGWHYAVSRDGLRFLVIRSSEEPVSIDFNWTASLKP